MKEMKKYRRKEEGEKGMEGLKESRKEMRISY
jgi:hypothetical protein